MIRTTFLETDLSFYTEETEQIAWKHHHLAVQ